MTERIIEVEVEPNPNEPIWDVFVNGSIAFSIMETEEHTVSVAFVFDSSLTMTTISMHRTRWRALLRGLLTALEPKREASMKERPEN